MQSQNVLGVKARIFLRRDGARQLTFLAAGMLMLKFRQVIDIFVDHDPVMDIKLGASTVSGFLHTRDHPSSCG